MVKVKLDRAKAVLFAEQAMKKDLARPLASAVVKAKATAPKDSGRMAANLRSRIRKVNGRIEGDVGIFDNRFRERKRRGEKGPRPTLAQVLVWVEGGRPAIRTPTGKRPGPMKFVPKGGAAWVITHSVGASAENDFLIRVLEGIARRYGAGVDEHI